MDDPTGSYHRPDFVEWPFPPIFGAEGPNPVGINSWDLPGVGLPQGSPRVCRRGFAAPLPLELSNAPAA